MKKVINITLGEIIFAIEQDAYEALSSYLEQVRAHLASDDAAEVINDIETAIAEKFLVRKRSEKRAVTVTDVGIVMTEMGSPATFGDGTFESNTADTAGVESGERKRRLYRDQENAVVAGVASGIAQYFGVDTVIVRLLFVVAFFFDGLGLLAYLILWFVVPLAKTTAEKYAMRGERVTLKDISERVKTNVAQADVRKQQQLNGVWRTVRRVLEKVFHALGLLARGVVSFGRFIVGVCFVVGGALGIAAMVGVYSVILLSEKVFFPQDVQVALDTLQGSVSGIVAMASSFVVMAIPLLALIIAGSSLLAKRNFFTTQKSVTLAVVWIVAAVLAGTTAALQVEQVMQEIGPIEGRFDDEGFQVEWENGAVYGDEHQVRFIHHGETESVDSAPVSTSTSGSVE